jgi:hypothetical protein
MFLRRENVLNKLILMQLDVNSIQSNKVLIGNNKHLTLTPLPHVPPSARSSCETYASIHVGGTCVNCLLLLIVQFVGLSAV